MPPKMSAGMRKAYAIINWLVLIGLARILCWLHVLHSDTSRKIVKSTERRNVNQSDSILPQVYNFTNSFCYKEICDPDGSQELMELSPGDWLYAHKYLTWTIIFLAIIVTCNLHILKEYIEEKKLNNEKEAGSYQEKLWKPRATDHWECISCWKMFKSKVASDNDIKFAYLCDTCARAPRFKSHMFWYISFYRIICDFCLEDL